jgi:DNA repair photolyase
MIVREVKAKSILAKSKIFEYTVNPYTGCAHACAYCYARFMQKYHPRPEPWGEFVDVKINAPELHAAEHRGD